MKNSRPLQRSKQAKLKYTKAVMKCNSDPTIPRNDLGSTISETDCEEDTSIQSTKMIRRRRRSKSNRFKLHLFDNWPAYLISFVVTVFGIYLLTIIPKITELTNNAVLTNEQIKTINSNLALNYNDLNSKMSTFSSDVKSIQDQFRLLIEMIKNKY